MAYSSTKHDTNFIGTILCIGVVFRQKVVARPCLALESQIIENICGMYWN
jgi:hypothetical protein